ncbi:TetR/AcrR family transcriptional regulator [Paenibacillus sp. DCT19]|uniref:TetR/AcrR family transcriptional regulator n=1 Tax=Paenibacillus sp. DCT19 TaxID=2211212 RepID=UPI000FE1B336|nr:TetR/AcrR family transcriptional regulator [Paenibacillus sp. DCT19]
MEKTFESEWFIDINGDRIQNANKNLILHVAIDLFSQDGYNAVSIRDITRKVGIKESSLYNHFSNKIEILETIYFNFRMDVANIIPPQEGLDEIVSSMDIERFLIQGLKNFMDHIENPKMEKIWRIIYLEQVRDEKARSIYLNDIVEGMSNFMEIVFKKYFTLGQIQYHDPKMLSVNYQYPLLQMVSLYILKRLDGEKTTEIEQNMMEHIRFFVGIVRV